METYDLYDPYDDNQSDRGDMDMDFLEVDLVRSKCIEELLRRSGFFFSSSCCSLKSVPLSCFSSGKSDSVLAMADATLDHLEHEALFLCHLEPSIFAERLSPCHGSPPAVSSSNLNRAHAGHIRRSSSAGSSDLLQMKSQQTNAPTSRVSRLSAFLKEMESDDGQEALLNNQVNEQLRLNGQLRKDDGLGATRLSSKGQAHRAGMVKGECAQFSLHSKMSCSLSFPLLTALFLPCCPRDPTPR